jgi:hypothetical protein
MQIHTEQNLAFILLQEHARLLHWRNDSLTGRMVDKKSKADLIAIPRTCRPQVFYRQLRVQ